MGGCAKVRFDPVLDTVTTFWAAEDSSVALLETITHPPLLGLISSRCCRSIRGGLRHLPDGRSIIASVGLWSPYFKPHSLGSEALEALVREPLSPGRLRA